MEASTISTVNEECGILCFQFNTGILGLGIYIIITEVFKGNLLSHKGKDESKVLEMFYGTFEKA